MSTIPSANTVSSSTTEPPSHPPKPRKSLYWTYGISRLLLLLIPFGLFPYPGGTTLVTDVQLYSSWADIVLSGHFPVNDPTWQYPPLAAVFFILGNALVINPVLGFMIVALVCDFIIFVALIRGQQTLTGAWGWVIGTIAVGPVLLTRFDVIPTLFAVLGLLMLARPIRSAALFAIGALLKIWPAFLVLSYRRRDLPKAIGTMLVTSVIVMSALSLFGPAMWSFLGGQGLRGLQIESAGALPYVVANVATGDLVSVFRYGSMEIQAPGIELIAMVITAIGLLITLVIFIQRLRGKLEDARPADIALTVVLLWITSSRVFSPQYMIWAVGIAAVCLLDPKSKMRTVILLGLVTTIAGQLVFPLTYGDLMAGNLIGVFFQTVRIVSLVAATLLAVKIVLVDEAKQAPSDI